MKKMLKTFAAGVFAIASGITAAAAEQVKVGFVYLTKPADCLLYKHDYADDRP